jgi:hypothetical protein
MLDCGETGLLDDLIRNHDLKSPVLRHQSRFVFGRDGSSFCAPGTSDFGRSLHHAGFTDRLLDPFRGSLSCWNNGYGITCTSSAGRRRELILELSQRSIVIEGEKY